MKPLSGNRIEREDCWVYGLHKFGQDTALDFWIIGHFRWVRLVSFLIAQKINSLKMLANLRQWVPFDSFFGHRILGGSTREKTKHEDTKEDEDTKTRRIPIPARGAPKWVSRLCLGVSVVGLMTAPARGSIALE
ncbi:MAG TPA: hypothetical protein VMV59_07985 [Candidatus Dormibacteraeota bacterium]|nr:hypothetical protein [Candidatus Dormibacteraeota bacterium]